MLAVARAAAQLSAARRLPTMVARSLATASKAGKAKSGATLEDAIANAHSNDDLAAIFDSIDASGNSDISIQSKLPVTITGSSAAFVEQAYDAVSGDSKKLGAVLSNLKAFKAAIMARDYSVHRFFVEPDYLPAETETAMNLLLTSDVALNKLDAIKNDDLREYFLVDKDTAEGEWGVARKQIKDAKLDATAVATLKSMAEEGKTHLLSRTIEGLEQVLAAASSTAQVLVTSAVDLTAAQKKSIEAAAKTYLPASKKDLDVAYAVDPAVMGGLVLQVDDVSVDLSSAALTLALSESVSMSADRA